MRIRCGTILAAALVALAVGATAGWFAAGAWRGCGDAAPALHDDGGVVVTSHDYEASSPPRAPKPPKVSEAELAALRDKAASLDKELKALLDARKSKSKADAQEMGCREPAGTLPTKPL